MSTAEHAMRNWRSEQRQKRSHNNALVSDTNRMKSKGTASKHHILQCRNDWMAELSQDQEQEQDQITWLSSSTPRTSRLNQSSKKCDFRSSEMLKAHIIY